MVIFHSYVSLPEGTGLGSVCMGNGFSLVDFALKRVGSVCIFLQLSMGRSTKHTATTCRSNSIDVYLDLDFTLQ